MFTTRSALTACLSISQHSLMNSRCVLVAEQGCGAPSKRVEEPVASDGDLAALRTTAAGLVFNECGGWGGWRGTASLGVGELIVCERPVDGFSLSPPGRALQADTMRKLVVLGDVVLKSSFPELLPAGASDGPPPLDWWPTQTNRQGDGGALGPHVVERGGIQIN